MTNTTICVVGNAKSMNRTRAMSRTASTTPRTIPIIAPISAVITPSCGIAPHLAPRHADRAEHSISRVRSKTVRRERVDDPEEAHEDGQGEEHEDVQHGIQAGYLVVDELLARLHLRVREVRESGFERRCVPVRDVAPSR